MDQKKYEEALRKKIINALIDQGFKINPHIRLDGSSKNSYRAIQQKSKSEQIHIHRSFLKNNLDLVKEYLPNPKEIIPENIDLELIEVLPYSLEEKLFRWWNFIWWSIPYQRAYGRQMRFILWDKSHNAPFGLIGLQSPILKLSVRDNFLNIPYKQKTILINKSMQAQRIGALPPYNNLIGGKMVALALTCNELRKKYWDKYKGRRTIIKKRIIKPDLLFITTSSAFGKSSIYNRLKYYEDKVAISLGYTKGYGTFHIPEYIYSMLIQYLNLMGVETDTSFGNGPYSKFKLISNALHHLKLRNLNRHNIKREYFLFPLVIDLKRVIENKCSIRYVDRGLTQLTEYWKQRRAIPRSIRCNNWNSQSVKSYVDSQIIKYDLN